MSVHLIYLFGLFFTGPHGSCNWRCSISDSNWHRRVKNRDKTGPPLQGPASACTFYPGGPSCLERPEADRGSQKKKEKLGKSRHENLILCHRPRTENDRFSNHAHELKKTTGKEKLQMVKMRSSYGATFLFQNFLFPIRKK